MSIFTKRMRQLFQIQHALSALFFLIIYFLFFAVTLRPTTYDLASLTSDPEVLSTDLNDPVRSSLEDLVLDAKESITLIIYSLSDRKILNALQTAAHKCRSVTIIYDPVETHIEYLPKDPCIRYIPFKPKGLMHNKLLVLDHKYVWTGSANLSTKSLTSQGNLVLAFESTNLAERIETLALAMIEKHPYNTAPLRLIRGEQQTTVYFHPYHGSLTQRDLVDRINKAKERVFVAMFTFTNRLLAQALVEAKNRGVDVRVVFDKNSSKRTCRRIWTYLKAHAIPCGYRKKPGLLHYKTALIDNTLVTGSCNWTKAAFCVNNETVLIIDPISEKQKCWFDGWWNIVEKTSSLTMPINH
jgi:cardiolipin synthase A/B